MIHFPGFLGKASLPLANYFQPKALFQTAKNYTDIGHVLNGDKHINELPCDKKVFSPSMYGERAFYLLLLVIIIISAIVVCVKSRKKSF